MIARVITNRSHTVRLSVNKVISKTGHVLVLMIIIKPSYFTTVPVWDIVLDVGRIICGIAVLLTFCRYPRFNKNLGLCLLYFAALMILSLLNGLSLHKSLINFFVSTCLIIFTDYLISQKGTDGLDAIARAFEILLFANLVCIFVFPDGIIHSYLYVEGRRAYLFGHQNLLVYNAIPGIVALGMLSVSGGRKAFVRFIFYLIVVTSQIFILWSATNVITILAIIALYVFLRFRPAQKILKAKSSLIAAAGTFAIIVVLRAEELFAGFIENVLHRDVTFSSRTLLWEKVMALISEKPLVGYGNLTSEESATLLGMRLWVHAHNQILDLMLKGGLILLICFLLIVLLFISNVDAKRDGLSRPLVCVTLPMFAFSFITEPPFTSIPCLFMLFSMAQNLNLLRTAERMNPYDEI